MKVLDGPVSSPLLRRLLIWRWIFNPLAVLEERYQRYGDIFTTAKNKVPSIVYVTHPKAIEAIFTADPNPFESGSGNRIILPLVGETSLLLLDGDPHARQRRLLMPPFHGERLRHYSQIICEIAQEVMGSWEVGQAFRIRESTQDITLRVILRVVFGLDEGDRSHPLRQLFSSFLESISSPLSSSLLFFPSFQKDWGPWSPWGRFLRLKEDIDGLLYAEIKARREEGESGRNDILTLLLTARDEAGKPMTDEQLRDELMTLLLAGHETTASALTWALYWVDSLPEVRDRLRQELANLPADADPMAISRLPYLSAVCAETLRIYPIAFNPFPRILKSPFEVMGYRLEAGTVLLVSIYLTHHRQEIYPDPKEFKPERFLDRQFSPYEYLPFGGGNRRCIGQALALLEMKLVLATIISHCDLKRVRRSPVKPVRRGLTIAPPSSMRMVVDRMLEDPPHIFCQGNTSDDRNAESLRSS